MPGWTGEYDWTGFVPVEGLPQALDPPSGRIVSANNKIVPDSYPYFLGRDWDEPFRARRIQALVDQRPQSLDASAAIQLDILSPMAERLLPLMLETTPGSVQARLALDRLARWDRRMDRDKAEPLIFTAWLREFNRTVFADKLGTAFDDYWALHPGAVESVLSEHTDWCDDRTTVVVEVCAEQLSSALGRALDELTKTYGPDMDEWRWGRAHDADFNHPLFSRLPVLRSEFAMSIPTDGGYDTINRGAVVVRDAAHPYKDVLGPALRMVVDMADPAHARFMTVPGQSGNPLSPHYGDLLQPWRDGYMLLIDSTRPTTTETFAPP
jgi:penicillin amidase